MSAEPDRVLRFDFRCNRCNWTRIVDSQRRDLVITCPECGTGDDVRWWRQRPTTDFVPPPGSKEIQFGEQPWNYTPTPEQLAERAEREAAIPVPVYVKKEKIVEREPEQLGLSIEESKK